MRWRDAARGESGQVLVLALGLALLCFAISGIAIDGTKAFLLRRSLQNLADAAALAGAAELDAAAYYESAGEDIVLDPSGAERMARSWLGARGVPLAANVTATSTQVRVRLRSRVETSFLRLAGIGSIGVAVDATAEPVVGAAP